MKRILLNGIERDWLIFTWRCIILEKSVGSQILAQSLESTALQKKYPLNRMGEAKILLKHCETNILH